MSSALQRRVEALGWEAPDESIRVRDVPGREMMAVLRLPPHLLEFSPELGYWCHLKAFPERVALLIFTYRLSQGLGSWVDYPEPPQNETEALFGDLGFNEGWQNSTPTLLVSIELTPNWMAALKQVAETGELGLTVVGGTSIYPVTLQPEQVEELESALLL